MTAIREIRVSAGLIWRGAKFLAAQRPEGTPHAGFWELPGGKWQAEESGRAALCRELREELGIVVIDARLLRTLSYFYEADSLRVILDFYTVGEYRGEPCGLEGQKLAWVAPGDAPNLEFLPADRAFISELARSSRCLPVACSRLEFL